MRRLSNSVLSSLVPAAVLVALSACNDTVLSPSADESASDLSLARGGRMVVSLDITPGTVTLSAKEPTAVLRATARDARGDVVKRAAITWESLSPQTVSVNASGTVTARRAGTALIVAVAAAVADTASVVVEQVAASVTVGPTAVSVDAGDSTRLSAVVKDETGTAISDAALTWTTSNSAVATVTSSGLVRGVAAGTATVKATSGTVSATSTVTVVGDSSGSGEPAPTDSTPTAPVACSAYPHSRLVNVSTASQLTSALNNAQPGDLIQLADGTYGGSFAASVAGTATQPIVMCGGARAVLTGSGLSSATILRLTGARYWTLDGFTVTKALIGIRLQGAKRNTMRRLTLHDFGQEAVVIKQVSSHNVLDSLRIYNTGRSAPQYGEAVYVGTTYTQWENGQPDKSDSNIVRRSKFGPGITTEAIDLKDGTTGTVVQGNTFDGTGFSSYAAAWVNAYGNGARITGNTGRVSRQHGYKVESLASGWGNNNVFRDNIMDLSGATGYGIYVGAVPTGNVVGCDNEVSDRPTSNRSCTP